MSKRLENKISELNAARRRRIGARTAELIAEEMSLRELRRAQRLTQKRMAEKLGIGQEGISRIEQRTDLLLSTLRSYVKAMGGRLSIVAEFPDRQPVVLAGLATMETESGNQTPPGSHRTR